MCEKALALMKHRGPDSHNIILSDHFVAGHTRLSIVDVGGGAQPIVNGDYILVVNGEIYNHKHIREKYSNSFKFQTGSDCEVIIPLFNDYLNKKITIDQVISSLDGIFAFVVINKKTGEYLVSRDAIGVIPLKISSSSDFIAFSSEIKGFDSSCSNVKDFENGEYLLGNYYTTKLLTNRWYTDLFHSKKFEIDYSRIRELLVRSIEKRTMIDDNTNKSKVICVPLSGGLDSALTASILSTFINGLHTFSIGMKGSPDLKYARIVADFLSPRVVHHEIIIEPSDVKECIEDAVWFNETYDVATIRSGIPMILMAFVMKKHGFKVAIGGDGADEIFCGYEYNKYAPSAEELHQESLRKVKTLSKYDCKRGNQSMMAHSIEYRCPFLDKDLVKHVMCDINPQEKMITKDRIEKYILRKAFDEEKSEDKYLPDEILWRSKMQFSVGCGNTLINTLKNHAQNIISDEDFSNRNVLFPFQTPLTKEAFLYRTLFRKKFGENRENTVIYEPSLNCSTKEVLHWFPPEIRNCLDPCGTNFS